MGQFLFGYSQWVSHSCILSTISMGLTVYIDKSDTQYELGRLSILCLGCGV